MEPETLVWIKLPRQEAFESITTGNGEKSVEVLVTGSLHLVGAMLTILDPALEDSL